MKTSPHPLIDPPQWSYRGGHMKLKGRVLHYQNPVDPTLGSYAILINKDGKGKENYVPDCDKNLTNKEIIKLLKLASSATKAAVTLNTKMAAKIIK